MSANRGQSEMMRMFSCTVAMYLAFTSLSGTSAVSLTPMIGDDADASSFAALAALAFGAGDALEDAAGPPDLRLHGRASASGGGAIAKLSLTQALDLPAATLNTET
jgi:hypothetical protein